MTSNLSLRDDQIERYSRNILLKEVGGVGQEKLLNSRVLLIGAGGLGSPSALYLAAAGVGTLGVADSDAVDLTNLQRQIAHGMDSLGRDKVESMEQAIRRLNPDVEVVRHGRIDVGQAPLDDYDVVLDGSDNFETRFFVNDSAVRLGVPLISAAVLRFDGQLTTVLPGGDNPCYRCLYSEPPAAGTVPSCSQAGILGAIAGTMGTLQATETVKLLLGKGALMVGKLLLYDGLAGEFRTVRYRRDPECKACGGENGGG